MNYLTPALRDTLSAAPTVKAMVRAGVMDDLDAAILTTARLIRSGHVTLSRDADGVLDVVKTGKPYDPEEEFPRIIGEILAERGLAH
jgi:hypothetical protein